ncbi:MAG: hypothetical protein AB1592_18845 [Pseudomonadota bacterium]
MFGSGGISWDDVIGSGSQESVPGTSTGSGDFGWDDLGKVAADTLSGMARSWANYRYNTNPDVITAKELGSTYAGAVAYRPGTRDQQAGGVTLSRDMLLIGAGLLLIVVLVARS